MVKSNYQSVESLKKLYTRTPQIQTRGEFLRKYSLRTESLHDRIFDSASNVINANPRNSILDIGAGNGSMLKRLVKSGAFHKYVAVDIAKSDSLSDQNDIEYVIYDGQHLPQLDGRFDCILMMHMLYHVENVRKFIKDVCEAYCKEGTQIIITTKSKYTMPNMERIFRESVAQLSEVPNIEEERDEAHFCLENGYDTLRSAFVDQNIDEQVLRTQLVVDNADDLLQYMLSTPRYRLDMPDYTERLREVITKNLPFEDTYTEVLYVIS